MSQSNRKDKYTTLWLTKRSRDEINRKKRKGESVEAYLKRRRVI
jgi:hypothetical protein